MPFFAEKIKRQYFYASKQMKRLLILPLLAAIPATAIMADETETDSIKVSHIIDEVVIMASSKEHKEYKDLPISFNTINADEFADNRIESLKNISCISPNLYIPEYGSRLTSAIYIRGIGTRINSPAVGLYVDNIPYIDKSAFDFNMYDIESIDILRGPQGTLYGRNTMGGLIKINTVSPFSYQGSKLRLSIGSRNQYDISLTHDEKINDKFAYSVGGFFNYSGGMFKNTYLNEYADKSLNAGGKIRLMWRPLKDLHIDFTAGYDHNDQDGYAYASFDKESRKTGDITANELGFYKRELGNAGLNIKYIGQRFILNSTTGYQYLDDHMFMDQDFTPRHVYTLSQKQKQHTITEDLTIKSNTFGNFRWTAGAFIFKQWLDTEAPVCFHQDGIAMIQDMMDKAMTAAGAPVKVKLTDNEMLIDGHYSTPLLGAAAYMQASYDNLFTEGLSLTAGIRIDYEKTDIAHTTGTLINADMEMMGRAQSMNIPIEIAGKDDYSYFQLLPKAAVMYERDNCNLFASVARGYRSGGYNIQMFSDIIRDRMQNMMHQQQAENIDDLIAYKPEYSWNYEIGTRLSLAGAKLNLELSAFYIDIRNQQISKFAEGSMGRRTENSGKSKSTGVELSFTGRPANGLTLTGNYGFTHATFTRYTTEENGTTLDYAGNFVPMIPMHTLSIGGEYSIPCYGRILDNTSVSAFYNAAGKIRYTEANDVTQDFYGTLNLTCSLHMRKLTLDFWATNVLNAKYYTFYFETIGDSLTDKAGFVQQGRPILFGVDVKFEF